MDAEVERLRAAIREFGAPSDVEPGGAGWEDVAVWFGSLLMLGPRATRGVGAFASVALVSRAWSRRQFRVEDRMRHVLRATLDLLAEDLEDRAAYDASVDELADRVHDVEVKVADVAEQAGVPGGDLVLTKDDVREYLDGAIALWRSKRAAHEAVADELLRQVRDGDVAGDDESAERHRAQRREVRVAECYIDAFQSARSSLLGAVLPEGVEVARGEVMMARHAVYPYPDGDTLVIGPEAFVAADRSVISYQGENYYSGRQSSPDSHVALTGLQDYLDDSIRRWRTLRDTTEGDEQVLAVHYIDAFQAVRDSIIGTVLPEDGPQSDEEAGRPEVPRELKLMTTRVADVLVRKGGGSIGVRYEPGDQPDMRWSVMGVLGRESEDSPMAGGAIHGLGATMIDALDQALREARG